MRRDELPIESAPAMDRPCDLWVCGRTGDACNRGPIAGGKCSQAQKCTPRRTWRGRRKQFTVAVLALFVVGLFIANWRGIAPRFYKPGELSKPHAQILSASLTSNRCASCHTSASTSPSAWFDASRAGHETVKQSDRCLDCHHTTIDPQRARLAHNLLPSVRREIRLASLERVRTRSWHDAMPQPAIDQENIECSACHREHRGIDGNLLDVSDAQCQSCHSDRFGSFAKSHPQWTQWPYGRGRQVAFNHDSHSTKHFPATIVDGVATQFQCSICHPRDSKNEVARAASYETSCKACHDQSLNVEAAAGVKLLALPTVPQEIADQIESWPESATGYFDGQIAPIMDLLLRGDKDVSRAQHGIDDLNFSRLSPSPASVSAASLIASGHRQLLSDVASSGQRALLHRASESGVSEDAIRTILLTLPPQLVMDAYQRWFQSGDPVRDSLAAQALRMPRMRLAQYSQPSTGEDLLLDPADDNASDDDLLDDDLLGDDLLGDDLLGDDLLGDGSSGDELLGGSGSDDALSDPLSGTDVLSESAATAESTSTRFDPEAMLPAGGWYRDDLTLTIAYRASGHADPVLKSTIELISELVPGDSVRERLLKTRGVASCIRCHPGAAREKGAWRSMPLIGRRSDFTKFSHSPHMNIASLSDCTHCHKIGKSNIPSLNLVSNDPERANLIDEFKPMTRAACASCHTAKAAGENCTQCHRYHIE